MIANNDYGPMDVWLRFDDPEDEIPTYEANTFTDDEGYRIEWYHNDVGQVITEYFLTYDQVVDWYTKNNYSDFTS